MKFSYYFDQKFLYKENNLFSYKKIVQQQKSDLLKKLIELRGVSKFNKDIDDSKWIELQVKLKLFGENLLNIKNNFSTTLNFKMYVTTLTVFFY